MADISMALCKTAESPMLTHWRYYRLAEILSRLYRVKIATSRRCCFWKCLHFIVFMRHLILRWSPEIKTNKSSLIYQGRDKNSRHFAYSFSKFIFVCWNCWIAIEISLKSVPLGLLNNTPALIQTMIWHRRDKKQLSELIEAKWRIYASVN